MTEPETQADHSVHVFNDDLLANAGDAQKARKLFPKVIHVLEDPQVIDLFRQIDKRANQAKRKWRGWGILVIMSGTLALIGASVAPLLDNESVARAVAAAAALSGLLSIVMGAGSLFLTDTKEQWLHGRFEGERLRQFHFQAFVRRFPDIIAVLTNKDTMTDFVKKRDHWLEQFKLSVCSGRAAAFENTVGDATESEIWLLDASSESCAAEPSDPVVDQFFNSYRWLRIEHQLRYANYKIGEGEKLSVRTLSTILRNATLIGLAGLVVLHLVLLKDFISHPFSYVPPLWIHSAIILIAVAALAVSALNEGLRPDRELDRYQTYRLQVRSVRDRFQRATTSAEKLSIMAEMERTAFYEMRSFLRTHLEAKFSM